MGATFSSDSKTFNLKNTDKDENDEYIIRDEKHDIEEAVDSPDGDRLIIEQDREPDSKIQILINDFQSYVSPRVVSSTIGGGLHGAALGHYLGEGMALRVYSFGFGYGFTATAFFTTLYGLKTLREKDDIINYAVAGSFNSAILFTALQGRRKGAMAGVAGLFGGAAVKLIGDGSYDFGRTAWINYRRVVIEQGRPRVMKKISIDPPAKDDPRYPRTVFRLGGPKIIEPEIKTDFTKPSE